ncbi:MAG: response regulator [Acidobacteriota bacterium]|nr:response regulator [Acidobacteriota bacterium]
MKTILLADDEAHLRRLVRMTLEDLDYALLEAADGAAALRLAREHHPDLLVLDWMMPGLSGLEVAAAVRRDRGWPGCRSSCSPPGARRGTSSAGAPWTPSPT